MKERRSKVFWVPERTIFGLFVEFTKSPPEYVSIPTPINLPEGAIVEYVRHDPWRTSFAFVVSHPSFPIWEDGAGCPQDGSRLEFTRTRRMVVSQYTIGVDPGHYEGDRSVTWRDAVKRHLSDRVRDNYEHLEEQAKALIAEGWEAKDLCIVQEEGKPDRMHAEAEIGRKLTAHRAAVQSTLPEACRPGQHKSMTDEQKAHHDKAFAPHIGSPTPANMDEQAAMLEWFKK
jgi:hypothetical protein